MALRCVFLGCMVLSLACRGGDRPEVERSAGEEGDRPRAGAARGAAARTSEAEPPGEPSRSGDEPEILFFGTSLTAGYGLDDPAAAFPARIDEKLDSAGLEYRVVNAGVPGETSAAGRRRIGWVLDDRPVEVVVVELGGNDGLRGLDPEELGRNLAAVVDSVRSRRPGAAVILAGMEAPPNMGDRYTQAFRRVYRKVAREKDVALIPFLLEGVGGEAEMNQDDRIHPNARGHRRMAENVWKVLEPIARDRAEDAGS